MMIAEKLGRYEIKAHLSEGGMSQVYLAYDPVFEREVAVKLLPQDLIFHPTLRKRFEREAKLVAGLDHPALVSVYDFGEKDNQPYIVMRYMSGGSLADRLAQRPFALEETVRVLGRIAGALDEVHAQGVIHRDLKPSNIMFDQWDQPFISDFGTAKPLAEDAHLTSTGSAVGTPAYMSPEQIQGQADVDGRSDIYALGVILFEMLAGAHPYDTNSPMGAIVQHITEPVPHILDVKKDLPADIQRVIDCAMAKKREDRYPSALALVADLQEASGLHLAQSTDGNMVALTTPRVTQALPMEGSATQETAVASPKKHHLWRGATLGGIIFFSLLIGGWVLFGGNQNLAVIPLLPTSTMTATAVANTNTPAVTEVMAVVTATKPATLTLTATPSATAVATEVSTDIPIEPAPSEQTIALEASSIFAAPDADSAELAVVVKDELVTLVGRAEEGNWLVVYNADFVMGYVFSPRFDWAGDWETLPIIQLEEAEKSATAVAACEGSCPKLTFDFYPLPGGRCANDIVYVTLYMEGRGGGGQYTYYWNGRKLAGPITTGHGFEINNATNAVVIGTGKVVSGDGQVVEKELYVDEFVCD